MDFERLWRVDQKWFWIWSTLWFLGMEIILRVKLGIIFWTAFAWFLILDWEAKHFFGIEFSSNRITKIFKSLYYSFLLSLAIFIVFFLFNAVLRSFDNNLTFFQLP